MSGGCGCSQETVQFACLDCGAACCPGCAVALESVAYCGPCADSLLGTPAARPGGPFDLH